MITDMPDDDPRQWPVEKPQPVAHMYIMHAMNNAKQWLEQAARGETPHGGYQPQEKRDE